MPVLLCRYSSNQDAMRRVRDRKMFEILRESVLTAERALLYALGFQFRIDHPHGFIRDTVDRFMKMPDPVGSFWRKFMQKEHMVSSSSVLSASHMLCFLFFQKPVVLSTRSLVFILGTSVIVDRALSCEPAHVQLSIMCGFINALYQRTKLMLMYDLRILGLAAIHLGLSTLSGSQFTWQHGNVSNIQVSHSSDNLCS
jgi:hypothetical protein